MALIDRLPRAWSGRRRPIRQPAGRPTQVGRLATAVRGTGPDGAPVEMAVDKGQIVLFFLTTGCLGCRIIWQGLAAGAASRPWAAPRIAVITPDPSTESARTVASLAPTGGGVPVVMSSETWHAYHVTGAPWWVVVTGGVVVSDSPAPGDWKEVETLLAGPDAS
jgi:hypothetical protein